MQGEVSGSLARFSSGQFVETPERMVDYSALMCCRFLSHSLSLSPSISLALSFSSPAFSLSLQVCLLSLSPSLLSLVRISSNNTKKETTMHSYQTISRQKNNICLDTPNCVVTFASTHQHAFLHLPCHTKTSCPWTHQIAFRVP